MLKKKECIAILLFECCRLCLFFLFHIFFNNLVSPVSPQVSLLQKSSSSRVLCHATGFYPKEVTISWQKNGQDHDEDVDLGELLPNEDGTFQKTSTITVTPDELKKNEYSCVVEHQDKTIRVINNGKIVLLSRPWTLPMEFICFTSANVICHVLYYY